MKELTDEQITDIAFEIINAAPHGDAIIDAIKTGIREALVLAAEDKTPDPSPECETCKYCGTSTEDPPCRGCSHSWPLKWEPKPARKPWPVGPFTAFERGRCHGVTAGPTGNKYAEGWIPANDEVIAFGLTFLPKCKAVLRNLAKVKHGWVDLDVLLAEMDKWDMPW